MTSDSHDIKQIRKSYEEKKRIDINPALHVAFFGQKWPMRRVANTHLRTYLCSNGSWDFTLLSTSIDIQHANFYLGKDLIGTTFWYKNFRNIIIQVKICKMQLVGREREVVIFFPPISFVIQQCLTWGLCFLCHHIQHSFFALWESLKIPSRATLFFFSYLYSSVFATTQKNGACHSLYVYKNKCLINEFLRGRLF